MHPKSPSRLRRGSTLIEVVLAGVLLSMIAASVFAAVSQTIGADARRRQRIAAHELASRLLLQYLDSPKGLPAEGQPYADGVYSFRWQLTSEPATVRNDKEKISAVFDTACLLRVRVFDGAAGAGGAGLEGQQLAEIVRFYSPFLMLSHGVDAKNRALTDEDFLKSMLGTARGGGGAGGGSRP
ncbi:MAG: type II secretion system protein [Phycisphaerales bacterium]